MGPMAYIKLHRLHGLRRELLAADPQTVSIAELALQWGFLNPGHFARDYRRLFGQLPSQTLHRGRQGQAFAAAVASSSGNTCAQSSRMLTTVQPRPDASSRALSSLPKAECRS